MASYKDNREFMEFYEDCSRQLRESRQCFIEFLQKDDDQLWDSQDFIRFLVDTTNELLLRQEQLLAMSRKLAQPGQTKTGGPLAATRRAL